MKESNSRREFLSQSGKMVTAAALFGTSVPLAHAAVAGTLNCEANNTMKITDPHYYLDNVLLETVPAHSERTWWRSEWQTPQ